MKARVSPAKCIIKGHDFELHPSQRRSRPANRGRDACLPKLQRPTAEVGITTSRRQAIQWQGTLGGNGQEEGGEIALPPEGLHPPRRITFTSLNLRGEPPPPNLLLPSWVAVARKLHFEW